MTVKQLINAIIICIITNGCVHNSDVQFALKSSGKNRKNLESVLEHYRMVDANPHKLMAAEFLIANMPAHYSYADSSIYGYIVTLFQSFRIQLSLRSNNVIPFCFAHYQIMQIFLKKQHLMPR